MKQDAPLQHNSVNTWMQALQTRRREILCALLTVGLTFGGYFGYRSWRRYQNFAAHRLFEQNMATFNTPVSGEAVTSDTLFTFASREEKWQEVALQFSSSYAAYPRSSYAPLFLAYAARAHQHLGDTSQAVDLLKKSIKAFRAEALSGWHQAQLAVLYLGAEDVALVQIGIDLLATISQDPKHIGQEFALYQLGNHYWYNDQFDQAQHYWNMLAMLQRGQAQPSEWFVQAKQKLKLLQ